MCRHINLTKRFFRIDFILSNMMLRIPTLYYKPLFLFFFMGICNLSYSQKSIRGIYIVNASAKLPVQDAFVYSEDLSFNASSDENGFVGFKNLPSSINKLHVSRVGFESKVIELSTLPISDYQPVIYLKAKVPGLAEVKVRAAANNGIFKTISDLDIHLRPINNSQEVLRMVPG